MTGWETWETEANVLCVVCPDCAFTFDACHENDTPEGGYSCPVCAVPEPIVCDECCALVADRLGHEVWHDAHRPDYYS